MSKSSRLDVQIGTVHSHSVIKDAPVQPQLYTSVGGRLSGQHNIAASGSQAEF